MSDDAGLGAVSQIDRELYNRVTGGNAAEVKDCLIRGANVDILDDKGDSPLTQAARRGDKSIVDVLIAHGATINHRNKKGSTPLIAAAMKGHTELVSLFLALGCNVNEETDSKDTALSLAVWQNHGAVCLLLMDAGADVMHIDQFGDTMLMDAAKHGNVAVMEKLLEKKVPIDHANKEGETALLRAAWKGEKNALTLLLNRGADIKHANRGGFNALIMASAHNNIDCVRILLDRGAPLDAVDSQGKSALIHCSSHWDEKRYQHMQWLCEAGCRLDQNKVGEMVLSSACEYSQYSFVAVLIEQRKINPNFAHPHKNGATPLYLNINGNKPDLRIVTLLLTTGKADPDTADNSGNTPLSAAVIKNQPDIVSYLLSKGASIYHENKQGENVLSIAMKAAESKTGSSGSGSGSSGGGSGSGSGGGATNNKCLAIILAAAGDLDPSTLLLNAAQNGSLERVKEALKPKQPAKTDSKTGDSSSSASAAAAVAATVNINFTNKSGQTALMLAARNGNVEVVRVLLDAGASMHQTDKEGLTALIHAIRKQNVKAAELLATYGGAASDGAGRGTGVLADEFKNNTRFMMRLGTRLLGGLDLVADLSAAHKRIAELETEVNSHRAATKQPLITETYAQQTAKEKAKRKAAAETAAQNAKAKVQSPALVAQSAAAHAKK